MKTAKNKNSFVGIGRMLRHVAGLFLIALMMQGCARTVYVQQPPPQQVVVTPPPWAPAYDNVQQVRYYYIPDWEVYYDVYNREYVYLDNGRWIFVPNQPPMYSGYDMNTVYIVVLDSRIHEPWMHHELYVSHYPRYYYQTRYNDYDHPVRGFNENANTPIYNPRGNMQNAPSHPVTEPGYAIPGNANRPGQENGGGRPTQQGAPSRPPQQTNPRNQDGRPNDQSPRPVNPATPGRPQDTAPATPVRPMEQNPRPQNRPDNINAPRPVESAPGRPNNSMNPSNSRPEPRNPQPAIYHEKSVGTPVKVQKSMMPPKVTQPKPAAPAGRPADDKKQK